MRTPLFGQPVHALLAGTVHSDALPDLRKLTSDGDA